MRISRTLALLGMLAAVPAFAGETTGEKAAATTNDATRTVKKGAHKVVEAACTGTKAECAAERVKHRATEAKDTAVDKAHEAKNTVD